MLEFRYAWCLWWFRCAAACRRLNLRLRCERWDLEKLGDVVLIFTVLIFAVLVCDSGALPNRVLVRKFFGERTRALW